MWFRIISFPETNLSELNLKLFKDSYFYDSKHPFSTLNNNLVSLGTIIQSIFCAPEDIHSNLIREYENKIELIKDCIKRNRKKYELDEDILQLIIKDLLVSFSSNSTSSFLENHKSSYFNIMKKICCAKSASKIFIYDSKLFDEYKNRISYDAGCQTIMLFSDINPENKLKLPSVKNLPAFLQSRNKIIFI